VRIGFAPLLIVLGATVACNAIVGFGDFQKSNATDDGGDDDDDNASSSSSGKGGSSSGSTTSSSSSSSSSSGAVVTPKCDVSKPFGTPVALGATINTGQFEDGASLTADELTIVFLRELDQNHAQLMIATRTSTDQDFGEATAIAASGSSNNVWPGSISSDGLTLYWSFLGQTMDIFMSQRATTTGSFVDKQSSAWTNGNYDEFRPSISSDGTEMFFLSEKDTTNGDLRPYHSLKTGGAFGAPVALSELNGDGTDQSIAISGDALTIYLASDRTGSTSGTYDVWTAHRNSRTEPFSAPARVPELSTNKEDVPSYVSTDGCRLYLASDLSGNGDIFVATKPL
jgi:hypothetical protein